MRHVRGCAAVAVAVAMAFPALLAAQGQRWQGSVISGVLRLGADTDLPAGNELEPDQDLKTTQQPAGIYLWLGADGEPAGEAIIHVGRSAELRLAGAEGGQRFQVTQGSVAIRYHSTRGQPLVVAATAAGTPWVRLSKGTLWLAVTSGSVQIALAEEGGQATRFDSALPEGADPQTASGGQAVSFDPTARTAVAVLTATLEQQVTQTAADEWLTRAESGDLLPNAEGPARATQPPVLRRELAIRRIDGQAVTPSVTSSVTQVVTGTGAASVQSTFSGVNALLTSGNPFSVLGAVRIERARIVGVSVTPTNAFGSQTGFLGFNTLVRPPIRLNP